jgi:hypothetical protein
MPRGTLTGEAQGRELAAKLIDFLETGTAPDGLSPPTRSVTSPCPSGAFRRREPGTS